MQPASLTRSQVVGKWLDPVADRVALDSDCQHVRGNPDRPAWLVFSIVIPDIILIINTWVLFKGSPNLPVSNLGKIRTALLLIGAPLLLLGSTNWGSLTRIGSISTWVLALACLLHVVAAVGYFSQAREKPRHSKRECHGLGSCDCRSCRGIFPGIRHPTTIPAVRANTGGLNVTGMGMLRLFKNPRWVFGLVLLGIGMSLNVYALASAPLTVVQPIGAIALVITTMVNGREHNIRMNRPTILAITACMVGSIGFVILAIQVSAESHEITPEQEMLTMFILAVVVIVFVGP